MNQNTLNEFYGPIIVDNCIESQKNQIIFQSKPKLIQNFDIDTYKTNNLDETNNIETFGDIVQPKKCTDKLKTYKKFLYNNRNNYHSLSEPHINNLVKLLNNLKITEQDIPKTFKTIKKNKPFYPSNHFI